MLNGIPYTAIILDKKLLNVSFSGSTRQSSFILTLNEGDFLLLGKSTSSIHSSFTVIRELLCLVEKCVC